VDAIHFLQTGEAPVTAVKQVDVHIRLRFLQWQTFKMCGYESFGEKSAASNIQGIKMEQQIILKY
jgi:hypothetical protein